MAAAAAALQEALGDFPPEAEEEEAPEAEEFEPREFIVCKDGIVDYDFRVGRLPLDLTAGTYTEVIAVTVVDSKLLVAVPFQVWARKVLERKLPSKALVRPTLCSVSSCLAADRSVAGSAPLKVWFGLLQPEMEAELDFSSFVEEADHCFGIEEGSGILPTADAMVEVASEHYAFQSAVSGGGAPALGVGPGGDTEERLQKLEQVLASIQLNLNELAKDKKGVAAPTLPRPKPATRHSALKVPKKQPSFPGLDPGVVSAALAAGVPESHLTEMSGIIKDRPRRLEDIPRPSTSKKSPGSNSISTESEDEEDAEAEADGDVLGSDGTGKAVGKAIQQLTKICTHLAKTDKKKQDPLEALLDGSGSASTTEPSSLPAARKTAAAMRAMRKALSDSPKVIYESLEAHLQSDYASRTIAPGEPLQAGVIVRGWVANKSRIMNYTNHVRWVWQVSAVWDCLINGKTDEARARCGLLVAAADQASIDGGNWLVPSVALLESPPPFQMFGNHLPPSPHELQHSALYDPRWFEVFLAQVKEMDTLQEAKKKLSIKGRPTPDPPSNPGKGDGKGKGNKKNGGGKNSTGDGPSENAN